jgi:KaiC/GvpD/RAD55 family RecA-like ATPase
VTEQKKSPAGQGGAQSGNNQNTPQHQFLHSSKFQIFKLSDLASLPPSEWLVKGVIPKDAFVVLYGPSGAGKTFVSVSLAGAIAAGQPWCGYDTASGSSLYIAGEGALDVKHRAHAWIILHNAPADIDFWIAPNPLAFLRPKDVKEALNEINAAGCKPALVVIDTLSRAALGADENSARDMGVVVREIETFKRATRATILILHHTIKKGVTERGSSALRAAADVMIECVSIKNLITLAPTLTLKCTKMRIARNFVDIKLTLKEVQMPKAEATLAVKDGTQVHNPAASAVREFALKVLRDKFPQGATFKEWLDASKLPRSTFAGIVNDLKATGRVIGGGGRGIRYHVAPIQGVKAPTNGHSTAGTKDQSVGPDQSKISSDGLTPGPIGSVSSPSLGGRTEPME